MSTDTDRNHSEQDGHSPELLAALEELSHGSLESAQALFRPVSKRAQRYLSAEQNASIAATSPSSLERHLIATHRHELGVLLEQACSRLLLTANDLGPYVLRSGDEQSREGGATAWRQRAEQTRRVLPDPPGLCTPLGILTRLMSHAEDQPDLLEAASAGLRIAPSTKLKLYSALGLIARRELQASEAVLHGLLDVLTPEADRRLAASYLMHIASLDQDHVRAVEWAVVASEGHEPAPTACLDWFLHSVQLGDCRNARQASDVISDSPFEAGDLLEGYCRMLSTDRLAGKWQPTQEALQFVRKPPFQLSNHATRILNVLN